MSIHDLDALAPEFAAEIRALYSEFETLRSRVNRLEREIQIMQEDLDLDY